jgi:outer membrane protein TolC
MKPRIAPFLVGGLLLAGIVVLGGCSGIRTANEKRAQEDLRAAESVYRPGGQKPPLPELASSSGLWDLIAYALLNNPGVESAFYEWVASTEGITVARSLPDPMFTLSAEILKGSIMALTPTLMTDPMANWPVPGKLALQGDAAYAESLMRRAAFEGEMLAAALAVKRAYYQLWVLHEQVRWTKEAATVVDDMERLALDRYAVGAVSQQDVLRAQMERDRLTTALVVLEDSRAPVISRMRAALGLQPDQALPDLSVKLEPTPADLTEESLLAIAFERNPRLKEVRGEVMQAVALFGLARKSTVPDFSFGVSTDVKASPEPWMPMAGVTLPIWRDKIAAEIAQGRAGVGAARARLSAEELDLAVRFAETAFNWREADRNAKLYGDALLPKGQGSLESARAGYAAGNASFLDVLEAERDLLDIHENEAVAVGQREIALSELSLMVLGVWPEGVPGVLAPQPAPASGAEQASKEEGGSAQ